MQLTCLPGISVAMLFLDYGTSQHPLAAFACNPASTNSDDILMNKSIVSHSDENQEGIGELPNSCPTAGMEQCYNILPSTVACNIPWHF